jgi:hypothetical protein
MRTVVEEKRVEQTIAEVRGRFPRVVEIFEGWKWRLSRAPEMGYRLPGIAEEIFLAMSKPVEPDHPQLLFLYRFDLNEVVIIDLIVIPPVTD